MIVTQGVLEQRYREATGEDLERVRYQGNSERPIVVMNRVTQIIIPLVMFLIPRFSIASVGNEFMLTGYDQSTRTSAHARMREVAQGEVTLNLFEVQNIWKGEWHSPFSDGYATLYLLK